MKGLTVYILKDKFGDSSNHGLSSRVTSCTLVGENVVKLFEVSEDCPPVTIVKRDLFGKIYLTAYPVKEDGTVDRNTCFGGTFIYSSDSRFSEISKYPVPLHDRKE